MKVEPLHGSPAGDSAEQHGLAAARLVPAPSPVDAVAAFLDLPYPALLESALQHSKLGRFSYLSADPFLVLLARGRHVTLQSSSGAEELDADPFDLLQTLLLRYRTAEVPGLPPFQGGALGYFAYDLAHHLERLPRRAVDDLELPEMSVAFYDWVIAWDHTTGEAWAVATGLPKGSQSSARERLDWLTYRLRTGSAGAAPSRTAPIATDLESNFTRAAYLRAIRAVKEYIASGDVYQVNLSQRFQATLMGSTWDLYRRLRRVNPAPFAAYLRHPAATVISASPEQFLQLQGGSVGTRPMKGTRPRGRDAQEDARLVEELVSSEKERAENLMIVDLLRNDLGRVCVPGSVTAPELFVIERYARVLQMVSSVQGTLRPDVGPVGVLKACFPGGSITGAPKIRAMEVIDELEPTRRSVYCGAIGYVGFNRTMHMSIPIRILVVKGRRAYFQVGGGIVADSDPEAEYDETLHKARGSLEALGLP